jgi:hypothetical protein
MQRSAATNCHLCASALPSERKALDVHSAGTACGYQAKTFPHRHSCQPVQSATGCLTRIIVHAAVYQERPHIAANRATSAREVGNEAIVAVVIGTAALATLHLLPTAH